MNLSPRAQALLTDFARQQGLNRLEFDESGVIPIRLDKQLDIAIGYSPANDALYLFGMGVDASLVHGLDPWGLCERNTALSHRRTRLSLDESGNIVLSADLFLEGLDLQRFLKALDQFVADLVDLSTVLRAGSSAPGTGQVAEASLPLQDGETLLIRI